MKEFSVFKIEIAEYIQKKKEEGKSLFATSSFQTQSAVLLHILSEIDNTIPIYFLNTGYHFPETLQYKKQLKDLLGLNVIDLHSSVSKLHQKNSKGELLYASDPDLCCYYNKVQPLESVLNQYDIWINGVRRDQTQIRSNFQKEIHIKQGILRYHPLLDWTQSMINEYLELFSLPQHPLAPFSVDNMPSIGCEPCTQLNIITEGHSTRDKRWSGLKKTECGLHTKLGVEK